MTSATSTTPTFGEAAETEAAAKARRRGKVLMVIR
jgi:hypothetical protein